MGKGGGGNTVYFRSSLLWAVLFIRIAAFVERL